MLRGDAASVQPLPGGASYLGPTLPLRRGQRVRIDFINRLPEASIVNWHGLHVPADMMGLPRYQIAPGGRYRYEFTVLDRAGTCWYHAMSAGSTPEQVYFGLAGLVIVSDAQESALALPRGADDLPLVIQDRDWGADNQFSYPGSGGPGADGGDAAGSSEAPGMMGGMMGQMMGGAGGEAPLADGAAFDICRLRVARPAGAVPVPTLPERSAPMPRLRAEDAANRGAPRTFRVTMGHMQWGFNGRSFEMNRVSADEVVRLGTTEVWEFRNNRMMARAIHLHGLQFLVLGRSHGPADDVRAGCVDEGWVDTVLLMTGERIGLLMQLKDFAGRYAYPCHMLEHAASGLMRAYEAR